MVVSVVAMAISILEFGWGGFEGALKAGETFFVVVVLAVELKY